MEFKLSIHRCVALIENHFCGIRSIIATIAVRTSVHEGSSVMCL
jgi:hypothetical protein